MDSIQTCPRRKPVNKITLFIESLKFFMCALLVGYVLSLMTEKVLRINRIYFYFLTGLIVATLASYFKLRMFLNPNYHPSCDCEEETALDGVFTILKHKKSAIFMGIPNTVMGMFFYTFMIILNAYGGVFVGYGLAYFITLISTLVSCIGSLYLWYTMICEVKSVCVICSTIHAMSFLTLVALV